MKLGRAQLADTGIGPGQAVDRSEAKTVRACHNQPKEPPESRPACRAGAEGETIREVSMADLVNLQDRLKAKQHEVVKYLERMDLTAKMIPVMVETVEKFTSMGASPDHIVRFLQATIEEITKDR